PTAPDVYRGCPLPSAYGFFDSMKLKDKINRESTHSILICHFFRLWISSDECSLRLNFKKDLA
ncbi:hypothetical protein, partial [Algoriphagus marinus]|uniref:hypothetical protein n=1 Tax=Algoriphagus marinus TaxID=1925762 RepID=UPI001C377316